LAMSITLGMLLSINLLATQPVAESQMAAGSATNAQTVSRTAHSPQG
jgi:hypothetical protein